MRRLAVSPIMSRDFGLQAAGQGSGWIPRRHHAGRASAQLNASLVVLWQMQQAFGQAQQALAQAERRTANAQLGQAAYGNLLSGDAQRLQAAGMLVIMPITAENGDRKLRNMQAAEAERRLRQAGMDIGYQDFLNKEPSRRATRFLQGCCRALFARINSTSFGMQPSTMQQLLGQALRRLVCTTHLVANEHSRQEDIIKGLPIKH